MILNLVTNAAEASTGGGMVTIRVDKRTFNDVSEFPEEVSGTPLTPGTYFLISVSDSGVGIPPEVRRQMFDPYFTTKTTGHGFGLSTVLGIVRTHQSALQVMSTPGHGSTITIMIRKRDSSAGTTGIDHPVTSDFLVSSSTRKILVVDDEAMVRRPLAGMLRLNGWEVTESDSGASALLELEQGNTFCAMIIDFTMPAMNGRETLKAIRAMGCETPAILCSGCAPDESDSADDPRFSGFLAKPFRREQLETLLASVLGS